MRTWYKLSVVATVFVSSSDIGIIAEFWIPWPLSWDLVSSLLGFYELDCSTWVVHRHPSNGSLGGNSCLRGHHRLCFLSAHQSGQHLEQFFINCIRAHAVETPMGPFLSLQLYHSNNQCNYNRSVCLAPVRLLLTDRICKLSEEQE